MFQLAAPHRRQRVLTRIFKFLTRTIRSPAVARIGYGESCVQEVVAAMKSLLGDLDFQETSTRLRRKRC